MQSALRAYERRHSFDSTLKQHLADQNALLVERLNGLEAHVRSLDKNLSARITESAKNDHEREVFWMKYIMVVGSVLLNILIWSEVFSR